MCSSDLITGGTLNGGVYLDQQQVVTQGLTMWLDAGNNQSYPGSGTTWYDLSGFGANISLQNSPAWTGGTPSYFMFNGANQYGVGFTANVLPNNQYTKSMWLRLNSYSYNNNVVSSFAGGHFTFGSGTNHFYSGHQDWANYNAFPTVATFDLGQWYYIAVTFEATDGLEQFFAVGGVAVGRALRHRGRREKEAGENAGPKHLNLFNHFVFPLRPV